MGASDVRAGGAFVEIGGISKGLESALNRAASRLKAFGASVASIGTKMAALGAIVTAPLIAAASASANAGAAIYDMSRRTGISVESLSSLGFAAKLSGSNMEEFETSLKRMQKTVAGVADATDGTTGNLEHLGIALETIRGKSPDEQFRIIGEALNKIHDPTEKAAAAMKVFGKSGTDVLPMISQLGELEGTAKKLGLIKTTESARQAKEYAQALTLVEITAKKVWDALSSAIIPILKEKAETVARVTMKMIAWIKANQSTVSTIFQVAAAVAGAGIALVILGKAISIVGIAVGGVSSALTLFRSVAANAGAILMTVLSSGIGLVIAGLVGLGAYLLYNSQVGKQVLSALGEYFTGLKDTAMKAFGGIKDAMAAGDWSLAMQILWLGVKTAFAQGIAPLMLLWANFKASFVKVAVGAFDGFLAAWDIGRNLLTEGWIKTIATLRTAWYVLTAGIRKAWESVVHFVNDMAITDNGNLTDAQKTPLFGAEAKRHREALEDVEKDKNASIYQANKSEKDELKAEQARHHDALVRAGEHYNEMADGADAAAKEEIAADKATLEAKKKELDAATKKAHAEAASVKPKESLLPGLPDVKLPSTAEVNTAIAKSVGVAGTFSAFGSSGVGGGSALSRTAKTAAELLDYVKKSKTDEIAKDTKKAAENLKQLADYGPFRFA